MEKPNQELLDFVQNNSEKYDLFVLKGFSMEDAGSQKQNLEETITNKIGRLFQIQSMPLHIISFDEFVCLFQFVLAQYKHICVIENGIFFNYYPVNATITAEITKKLLVHYDDEADDNENISGLEEYTNIYSNYLQTDVGIACVYNIDDGYKTNQHIEVVTLNNGVRNLKLSSNENGFESVNMCDEADYYCLVQNLLHTNNDYCVGCQSFYAGNDEGIRRLERVNATFESRVFIYNKQQTAKSVKHIPEVQNILAQYWHYTSFRNIKMYDTYEASQHRKKVITISQEEIINSIIEQEENCLKGQAFEDVFVTAPTGSGKSLMFQLPAIYLAEKYGLMTLVISPLIGLMNDQIRALEECGYTKAKTINSDIPAVIKTDILENVQNGNVNILYLSPETLLAHSNISDLIGNRKIGLVIVDEAHIVTTWGKQFRPDYWFLGDRIQKLRRQQQKSKTDPSPFVIATFTATAIYGGNEDMYSETINSMHMVGPRTYLGYVKRDNISIEVKSLEALHNKVEYQKNKFDELVKMIRLGHMRGNKILIYFPTVALVSEFYGYCLSSNLSDIVTRYHGQLDARIKDQNLKDFHDGKKTVMLATKAFGMGIDIPDITIVAHFAPTGNVCDYVQEIGRAARDKNIQGHAIYNFMGNDFKYINQLYGMSTIKKYQLIEVIRKILEIYNSHIYKNRNMEFTRKRNGMLVDAESFAYIFDTPTGDHNNNELVNKVKTAMLMIQKDYENSGASPFHMRPSPLFKIGYFALTKKDQNRLNKRYRHCVDVKKESVSHDLDVCAVDLQQIWEKDYDSKMTFPKFKAEIYTKSPDLQLNTLADFIPAMLVTIDKNESSELKYKVMLSALRNVINRSVVSGEYKTTTELAEELSTQSSLSKSEAESVISTVLSAMSVYRQNFAKKLNGNIYISRLKKNGTYSYSFQSSVNSFFQWLDSNYRNVMSDIENGQMYVLNNIDINHIREVTTVLGILESFNVIKFESLGGNNSQLYIYVNQTKNMQLVVNKPGLYDNKLLDLVEKRHKDSVKMLEFLFTGNFTSDQIWNYIENYFLGISPQEIAE